MKPSASHLAEIGDPRTPRGQSALADFLLPRLAAPRNLPLQPTDAARGIHLPECCAAVALDLRLALLQLTFVKL